MAKPVAKFNKHVGVQDDIWLNAKANFETSYPMALSTLRYLISTK